jgi:hypothetical protein
MLEKQVPFSHIEQALKMSPTTVARYSVQVEGGKFTHLARWFKTIHNRKIFWQSVEILIRAGLPARGKDRWKYINEQFKKHGY